MGLSWIPIWYLSEKKCGEFGSDFDWKFFLKNLFFLTSLAAMLFFIRHSWSPEGMSGRMESIFWLSIVCCVHIIAFAFVNRSETRELFLEIRAMLSKKRPLPYSVTSAESGEATP
ncbi:MAG: Polysaccharide biosynthesis protein [Patescibacteria group bacterium]|nr:Polysaccharide biosynthesis protein [Patescibacteria group bacterium]